MLDQLREHIRAGTPIVGMEPSCLAVFKDELGKMLPHDDDAQRMERNVYHFGEFFRTFDIEPPKLAGQAILWGHCHHRATGGVETEKEVLEQMGLDTNSVEGGCCGLAGSWGFEKGKWQISLDCGEQAYLPAVRDADEGTLIVANGFSCQTQLMDVPDVDKSALHLAQVLKLAREKGSAESVRRRPTPAIWLRAVRTAGPVALAAVSGAAAVAWGRRKAGRHG